MTDRTGPPLRILSDSLRKFRYISGAMFYGRREVSLIEVAGVCVHRDGKLARMLDFCGEVLIETGGQEIFLDLAYLLVCRVYMKDGRMNLCCKSARRLGIFEEMFFWAEASNLRRSLKYNRNRH
ncbi:uncharacterized protein Eint_031040 [Encephalitozoon intestinalis ATCC 50506]|uniref:Uncharacterized protein n=1 Tax=Encephalitozoon intestinalis (strain ATCC 50506) TaxID=876142 RepID=E0S6B2_ENCIT|nr:uncharacterized protein Eint_031040 [Encephalitozoon intestinalis ATCC 50506]ADM11247.1 hypothetical protein Eint_031040 [Encephalitozoon intestinalis ATCC 50506]UTX44916.1 protein STN1 [Encephalitozoon intestinalis]